MAKRSYQKAAAFFLALITMALCPAAFGGESFIPEPPSIPRFASDSIIIDGDALAAWEETYRSGRTGAGREDFLFAWLPERVFHEVLSGEAGVNDMPHINGTLFLSGHEGGVWLNRTFIEAGQRPIGSSAINSFRLPALLGLDQLIRRRLWLVRQGGLGAKRAELKAAFNALVFTYGYNRGYLLEVLRRPPAGQEALANSIVCGGLIECDYPEAGAALSPLLPLRDKLAHPSSDGWKRMSRRLDKRLPGAIERGGRVWEDFMERREFGPGSYRALVDVSAGYLAINEAVMLMAAQGLAEDDEESMDRALMADAALSTWLGGYLLGLGQVD